MGNSGLAKLYSTSDVVETHHHSPLKIDLLTLDRKVENLESLDQKHIIFFLLSPQSLFFGSHQTELKSLQASLKKLNVEVVALATNTFAGKNQLNFEQLSRLDLPTRVYPQVHTNNDR